MKTILYITFILIFLSSCVGGLGLAVNERITGNYYLVAADDIEQLSLSYHTEDMEDIYGTVVGETVFAVGFNNHYIIVKQHPNIDFKVDKTITNYYILPLKEKINWENINGLMGPLRFNEFNQKRKELNIEDLEFTINYKDLE
jgi:hypothetical protein